MSKLTYFMAERQGRAGLKEHGCDPNGLHYWFTARHRWDETRWLLHRREVVDEDDMAALPRAYARLMAYEPPQYVAGVAPFYGRWFQVNQSVLIPEDETNDLVDWALEVLPEDQPLTVLDLGTGSGCIGITLALIRPCWEVVASDVSAAALAVARDNAQKLGADLSLVKSDLFANLGRQRFDAVVTNPPYVATTDKPVMDRAVLDYEPNLALFAGSDGLAFYRRLFTALPQHLTTKGHLFGETGYDQEMSIVKLFKQLAPGANLETRHDAAGRMRMIHGCDFLDTGGK